MFPFNRRKRELWSALLLGKTNPVATQLGSLWKTCGTYLRYDLEGPLDASGDRQPDGILYLVVLIWQKRRLFHHCEYLGAEARWPVGPYPLSRPLPQLRFCPAQMARCVTFELDSLCNITQACRRVLLYCPILPVISLEDQLGVYIHLSVANSLCCLTSEKSDMFAVLQLHQLAVRGPFVQRIICHCAVQPGPAGASRASVT